MEPNGSLWSKWTHSKTHDTVHLFFVLVPLCSLYHHVYHYSDNSYSFYHKHEYVWFIINFIDSLSWIYCLSCEARLNSTRYHQRRWYVRSLHESHHENRVFSHFYKRNQQWEATSVLSQVSLNVWWFSFSDSLANFTFKKKRSVHVSVLQNCLPSHRLCCYYTHGRCTVNLPGHA